MQERWFSQGGGVPAAAATTLKQLPIFRSGPQLPPPPAAEGTGADPAAATAAAATAVDVAGDARQAPHHATPAEQPQARRLRPAADGGGPGAGDETSGPHFVDLATSPRRLPPPGTPSALLSDGFLIPGSAEEAAVLKGRLAVPQLERHDFVASHLLPRAAALPAAPRDAALVEVLRGMAGLPEALRQQLSTVRACKSVSKLVSC